MVAARGAGTRRRLREAGLFVAGVGITRPADREGLLSAQHMMFMAQLSMNGDRFASGRAAALRAVTAHRYLEPDGAGGWCCAIRVSGGDSFARRRRAVPVWRPAFPAVPVIGLVAFSE